MWTIGFGHTSAAGAPEVFPGQTITAEQADEILAADLETVERQVTRYVTVPLTQNQFDALVSFVFNVGAGNFRASSLLRRLNAGDYSAVPAELLKWTKARVKGELKTLPGLVTRRHLEASLWDGAAFTNDAVPKLVEPPAPKGPRIVTHVASAGAGVAAGGTAATSVSVNCATIGADLHRAVDLRLLIPIGLALLAVLAKFAWDTWVARTSSTSSTRISPTS